MGCTWVCPVGRSALSRRVCAFCVCEPRCAERRRAAAGQQPAGFHLRQIQPVHHQGQRASIFVVADVRFAARRFDGRNRHRLWSAGRRCGSCPRWFVRHLPPAAGGAFSQRQARAGGRREAQLRHAGGPLHIPCLQDAADRGGGRGCDQRPHRALPLQAAQSRAAPHRRRPACVQPRLGRRERQGQAV